MKKKLYFLCTIFYAIFALSISLVDMKLYLNETKFLDHKVKFIFPISSNSTLMSFENNLIPSTKEQIVNNILCEKIKVNVSRKGIYYILELRNRDYFINKEEKIKKLNDCKNLFFQEFDIQFKKNKELMMFINEDSLKQKDFNKYLKFIETQVLTPYQIIDNKNHIFGLNNLYLFLVLLMLYLIILITIRFLKLKNK